MIIKVINNIDYMIIEKYNLPSNYYSFSPEFDLIYTKVEKEYKNKNRYDFYFNTLSRIINNSKSFLINAISNFNFNYDNGKPPIY